MEDFGTTIELRINNTFVNHKLQHNYTFENTRGQLSLTDFVVSNRAMHHKHGCQKSDATYCKDRPLFVLCKIIINEGWKEINI